MQSLVILGIAFTLLASYIESDLTPKDSASGHVYTSTVIRNEKPLAATDKTTEPSVAALSSTKTQSQATVKKPLQLNLSLPESISHEPFVQQESSSLRAIFKASKKPSISYDAELVYDAEKGEDITGGKLNITIPFG